MNKKYLFIICDGIGDLPIPELGNKTPLEAAFTPNLDRLAKNGRTGLMYVLGPGKRPDSHDANLTILGYKLPEELVGRGIIEAAGVGLEVKKGEIAIRGNLATIDKNLIVIDRRANRIEDTANLVKEFDCVEIEGVKFRVKAGTAHRLVIVMSSVFALSDQITNSDVLHPAGDKIVRDWKGQKVNRIVALTDADDASLTASALQKFLDYTHQRLELNQLNQRREKNGQLKGNYILTRCPSLFKTIPCFPTRYALNSCCIAGAGLYKGLGKVTGMDLIEVSGATGMVNTNLMAKTLAAKKCLEKYDFVFLHIKGTDILGEDGNYQGKKEFIEKIDLAIDTLEETGAVICVTADHSTPCILKDHSADPVPVLIWERGKGGDSWEKFGEKFCQKGSLGIIEGKDLLKTLFSL